MAARLAVSFQANTSDVHTHGDWPVQSTSGRRGSAARLLKIEATSKIKHIATIWGMYVSSDNHGTGLAKGLVQAAVAEARSNCVTVRLSVVTSNEPAIRLYERAGFKTWTVDTNALYVNGAFLDEALMRVDFV